MPPTEHPPGAAERGLMQFGCQHYRRRCKLITPCCGEVFWCRHCHNEAKQGSEQEQTQEQEQAQGGGEPPHGEPLHACDRKAVRELVCALCDARQPVAAACTSCGAAFGRYACLVCNFFDDDTSRGLFHCDACGICRTGGRENFSHCHICNMCIAASLKDTHVCVENTSNLSCPVCSKALFDSIAPMNVQPCGHMLHEGCRDELYARACYDCPICFKPAVGLDHLRCGALIAEAVQLDEDAGGGARARAAVRALLSPEPGALQVWACKMSVVLPALLGEAEGEHAGLVAELVEGGHGAPPASPLETVPFVLYQLLHGQDKESARLREALPGEGLAALRTAVQAAHDSGTLGRALLAVLPVLQLQPLEEQGEEDALAERVKYLAQTGLCQALGELALCDEGEGEVQAAGGSAAAGGAPWVAEACARAAALLAARAQQPQHGVRAGAWLANSSAYLVGFWARDDTASRTRAAGNLRRLFDAGFFAALARAVAPHDGAGEYSMAEHLWSALRMAAAQGDGARQLLRDLGLVASCMSALAGRPPDEDQLVGFLANMALSPAVHTTLKEAGVVGAMERAIERGGGAKLRVCATALAHLCCGVREDAADAAAAAALERHDISSRVAALMADAAETGVSRSSTNGEALGELAAACASLARTPQGAARLAAAGLVPIIVRALGNRHGREPEACLQLCRALHFMLELPELRAGVEAAGGAAALLALLAGQPAPSARVVDMARGCLLQLGQLEDGPAREALRLSQQTTVASLDATAGAASRQLPGSFQWDVFLSHKRSDSKDFARALHTLLVTRGLTVFLDFEWREELTQLQAAVSSSRVLVFVLSDNVLQSGWCIKELSAAVHAGTPVVLLTKEGARWSATPGPGLKTELFPARHEIEALPAEVRGVFDSKPVVHSDEYYAAFVEQLMDRVSKGIGKRQQGRGAGGGERAAVGAAPASVQAPSARPATLPLPQAPPFQQATALQQAPTPTLASLPPWAQQHIAQLQQQLLAMQQASLMQPLLAAAPAAPTIIPQAQEQAIQEAVAGALRRLLGPQLDGIRHGIDSDLVHLRQHLDSEAALQLAATRQELAATRQELGAEVRHQVRQLSADVQDLGRSVALLAGQVGAMQQMVGRLVRGSSGQGPGGVLLWGGAQEEAGLGQHSVPSTAPAGSPTFRSMPMAGSQVAMQRQQQQQLQQQQQARPATAGGLLLPNVSGFHGTRKTTGTFRKKPFTACD